MQDKGGFAAVSRRDAIRLIAVTPASGAALASGRPLVAMAEVASPGVNAADVAGHPVAQNPGPNSAPSLAKLAAEHFEPLIGEKFVIGEHAATLRQVHRGLKSRAWFRQQFALTFAVAPDLPIHAEILPLSHPAIGRHDLHVTAINGTTLEICFS